MSMNEHSENGSLEEHDVEHEEHEEHEEEFAPKKNSKAVMAAAVAGVVAVFGFAGFQIYNKVAAKPSPGIDQSMMAPPASMQAPAQPMVPAGPVAQLGQPAPAQMPLNPDAGPVQLQLPVAAPVGAPVVTQSGALGVASAAPPGGASAASTPPSGAQFGQSGAVSSLNKPAGSVDMGALNSLKKEQEEQAKKIESFDDRLSKLEARIAQLGGTSRAERAPRADDERPSVAERRSAQKIAASKKALLRKKKLGKKDLARLVALKEEEKRAKDEARQARLKKTAASKSVESEGSATASSSSGAAIKLPPTPIPETPKAEPKPAAPNPVVTVKGLRVQAVIPGRVWIQDDSGATRSFATGDSIKSGVVVKSIDADKGVVETSIGNIR